jgi:hypothetical protein
VDIEKKKLLNKIKHLLALGDKTKNNSVTEAEAAFSKAQEMMTKYNISLSDVEVEAVKSEKTGEVCSPQRSKRQQWEVILAEACAKLFDAGLICNKKGSSLYHYQFVGIKADAEMACEVFKIISNTAKRLSLPYAKISNTHRNSFCIGFARAIYEKVKFKPEVEASNYQTLMVIKNKIVQDMIKEKTDGKVMHFRRPSSFDGDAYRAGIEAGEQTNLNFKNTLTV